MITTRVPAIVLSGFLGSGKTTLLLRLLEASMQKGLKPAILMNELGKRDVDGIELTLLGKELGIQKLLDGCICCSRKQELSGKLKELLLLKPDILFIELTGVANPEEVALALSEGDLITKIKLHKVITLLDAEHVLEYNSWLETDLKLVRTLRRQIATADLLILNKVDLVKPDKLPKVLKEVRKQNATSPLLHAQHSQIDVAAILGDISPSSSAGKPAVKRAIRPGMTTMVKKKTDSNDTDAYSKSDEHVHSRPSFSRIRTVQLSMSVGHCPTPKEIEKFLAAQGQKLLRAKGFVFVSRKSKYFLMQYAGKRVSWEPADYYRDDPYLVLIGLDMVEQDVEKEWARQLTLC